MGTRMVSRQTRRGILCAPLLFVLTGVLCGPAAPAQTAASPPGGMALIINADQVPEARALLTKAGA